MTNFSLPIYTMIAVMVFMFLVAIVIIVAIIVLLIKAIRYSGSNDLLNKTFNNPKKNTDTFRYDPYSMDDGNVSNHCPQCNEVLTADFRYCPKCGVELKSKDNIVKLKVN